MLGEEKSKKIQALIKRIESRKTDDSKGATYRDVPDLKEIDALVEEGVAKDKDALSIAYACYYYLGQSYGEMGRFSIAATYRYKALQVAKDYALCDYGKLEDVDDLFYALLRDRNYYVDDDCEDVVSLAKETKMISEAYIDKTWANRLKVRRHLKNDPVESSEAYLAVIDEVEEKIAKNRTTFGMGSCFEVWALKERYLAEKGIAWSSPALLNPRVMFD